MGALLMLALMAIPLSAAQYAPDGTAALVRFLESSHMFRSVLEPQSDFGPTEPQEVRTCTRHAYFAVHAHEAAPDFPRSRSHGAREALTLSVEEATHRNYVTWL
jgi:hypothetical protein